MVTVCEVCHKTFEAKQRHRKYCSDACRKRAERSRRLSRPRNGMALAKALRAELVAAGREKTTLGVLALDLAREIEAASTPATTKASLARQLIEVREQALAGAQKRRSAVDELRERREQKRGAGRTGMAHVAGVDIDSGS